MPLYYRAPENFQRIMRDTIALNASFFNTQRMVEQYAYNAYGFKLTPGE
jgi:starch phosphorylase